MLAVNLAANGAYELTLDRPVLYDFGPGDRLDVLPLQPDIDIFGNGAVVTGSASRLFEFFQARGSIVDGVTFIADDSMRDLIAAFDLFGRDNEFRNVEVIGNGYGTVGLALESQENSRIINCRVSGVPGVAISLYDNVNALVRDTISENNVNGIAVTTDGNVKGSLASLIEGGTYSNNSATGISVHNGSMDTRIINVTAANNPINIRIGDPGSFVSSTQVTGSSLASALSSAVTILGTVSDTTIENTTFDGSPVAVNLRPGADIDVDGSASLETAEEGLAIGGSAGRDTMEGGDGPDTINGSGGNDRLLGGDGDDMLRGGEGQDELNGQSGSDTVDHNGEANPVFIDLALGVGAWNFAEGDTYTSIENIIGSESDDRLIGDDADNRIAGGAGADVIDGGPGSDTLDYSKETAPVAVDLTLGTGGLNTSAGDTYSSMENIIGSGGPDQLKGSDEDNRIEGGNGNDLINGAGGTDLLVGGAGQDTFEFSNGYGIDTIADFTPGSGDVILLLPAGVQSFTEVRANMTQMLDDTLIDLGNGDRLVLANVLLSNLKATDFQSLRVDAPETTPASSGGSGGVNWMLVALLAYLNLVRRKSIRLARKE
ncbi:MAG: hypothetical protein AB8G18_06295 [Gammaproteobacteria bacterium]